ncbi:MFS general substrate transporter [Protomyces lactucae-debilis]|uniref:MFS general substrate transporter n=1 Tax=Protomyces lactucae-debilis TaxID=2754530 RepID=A0A1Y2EXL9_PROLT|nr:MFS general substrate transporter [Protomyces lactucae-debilis]ORY76320.1 MFS general substrate transporter [Protomyces lactucae-debilis]
MSQKQIIQNATFEIDGIDSALLRKIDLRVVPMITMLYFFSFLDRTSISNARVAGLQTDLKLSNTQYNIALSVLFVSYVSWEIPSNLLLKRFSRPSLYLPSIVLAWGIITTLTCLVQNFAGLVACRVFLGFTEAGLFPGAIFYLSLWYQRRHLLLRVAIFFSSATLAGAFSGLLATGLTKLNKRGGLEGWRWLFAIEGLMTIAGAIVAFFFLADFPATAKFLSPDERLRVVQTLEKDWSGHKLEGGLDWHQVRKAFKDYRVYLFGLLCIGIALPTFSFALFLPSIISAMGFSAILAQALTVPPYACAFFSCIGTSYLSDRTQRRAPFILFWTAVAMVGYIILLATNTKTQPAVQYFSVFLCATGIFTASALNIGWLSNQIPNASKRAAGAGFQLSVGQLGGVAAAYIYPRTDAPRYRTGHATALGFLCLALLSTSAIWVVLARSNRQIDEAVARGQLKEGSEETFRYTL